MAFLSLAALRMASLLRVSRGGVVSLLGFIAVVVTLAAVVDPSHAVGPMLWVGLVVIWGLTVPHMLLISRFDARMRATRQMP